MSKFTEEKLEKTFIELMEQEQVSSFPHNKLDNFQNVQFFC
jgi:hypothetical protein